MIQDHVPRINECDGIPITGLDARGATSGSNIPNHDVVGPKPAVKIRPGLRTTQSWFYGDTYQNHGLVETKSAIEDAPPELSVYVSENSQAD